MIWKIRILSFIIKKSTSVSDTNNFIISCSTFLFYFVWVSHSAVLIAYFCFCVLGSLLVRQWGDIWCQGSNSGGLHRNKCPTCYITFGTVNNYFWGHGLCGWLKFSIFLSKVIKKTNKRTLMPLKFSYTFWILISVLKIPPLSVELLLKLIF